MRLLWDESAWEDYCYWQTQDKKTLKKINALIKDIQRDTFSGLGKPGTAQIKFKRLVEQTDR